MGRSQGLRLRGYIGIQRVYLGNTSYSTGFLKKSIGLLDTWTLGVKELKQVVRIWHFMFHLLAPSPVNPDSNLIPRPLNLNPEP